MRRGQGRATPTFPPKQKGALWAGRQTLEGTPETQGIFKFVSS